MIPLPRLLQIRVLFAAFIAIADAALVNVTVDDAVLIGPIVPQYLPSPADWNAAVSGDSCVDCGTIKLDSSRVYNRTWHDATYKPSNNFTQMIEFTFTGSAVYIFFALANKVVGFSSTLTDVQFVLDQVTVSRYTHVPTTSTDYQYNVAVYSNDSLALGSHNMVIQPVIAGNNVLMLFDYLIYTTNTSSSVSPSPSATTTTLLPSSTSSGTEESSPNIGMIVGTTVGAVALVGAALLYYRRYYKRRGRDQLEESDMMNLDDEPEEEALVDPFILSHHEVTAPITGTTATSAHRMTSVPGPTSKFRPGASSTATLPSTSPLTPTDAPSSTATSSRGDPLREEVQLLRGEVARLRERQNSSVDVFELSPREPPPSYS